MMPLRTPPALASSRSARRCATARPQTTSCLLIFTLALALTTPTFAAPPGAEDDPVAPASSSPTTTQEPFTNTPVSPLAIETSELLACFTKPVTAARIVGCDATCEPPLRSLMAPLARSQRLTEAALTRFLSDLDATQLTQSAHLHCLDAGPAALIELTVTPTPWIRRVTVTGNEAFRRKDILKRVFLRPGTPLAVDPAQAQEDPQIRRQSDSIERLYRQAGLDDVRVDLILTPFDLTHVDLEVRIREGTKIQLDDVDVQHVHRAPTNDGAAHCPTIDQRRLERLVGLGIGDTWTRVHERQVRDRIKKAFQAAGFERPKVSLLLDPPPTRILHVTVETDRCWLIHVWQRELAPSATSDALSFRWEDPVTPDGQIPAGARRAGDIPRIPWRQVPRDTLDAVLPFAESGSFERDEAARAVTSLAADLRARGYPFARVRVEHRAWSHEPTRLRGDIAGTIDFFITRNLARRVNSIHLQREGTATFDDATLIGLMKTQAYDFFGGSGAFDEQRVLADLATLEAYYRERGFFSFRFLPPLARPGEERFPYGAGSRLFALSKRSDDPNPTLLIRFDEGPRLRLGNAHATGVTLTTPAALLTLAGLKSGTPFGPLALKQALESIGKFYRSRGHHRLQIEPVCLAGAPTSSPVPCTAEGMADEDHLDLELHITEGPLIRVGAITWRGNAEARPNIITRDLPQPGELLDFDRINLAVRKMRALGVFNSVRVDVEGLDEAPTSDTTSVSDVTLIVSVEETPARFLDVALGVRSIRRDNLRRVPAWAASGSGILVDQADRVTSGLGRPFALDIPDVLLTFDFEYVDLNVDGAGNRLAIPFNAGFSLSQFLRLATFNPSFTQPRLLGSDLRLTTRAIAELDRVTDPLDRLELGLEGDLVIPLSDVMLAGLTARAGVIQLQTPDEPCAYCLTAPPLGFGSATLQDTTDATTTAAACVADPTSSLCRDSGFRPQFSVGLRWRWDTRDTPLHPTRGFALSASTSFILDRDRLAASPVFNQFIKWEASVRAAFSIDPVVIAAYIRYGGSSTFDQPFLPAVERFTLGGSNGIRGFSDNGICRYQRDGSLDPTCATEFGGNVVVNGSLELRVPLLAATGIWLGGFFDFGALAKTHNDLYAQSFRASAGVGLRWLLGGLFPIRLDIGFPLFSRRCLVSAIPGVCILEDASQVHFGLLYTF